MNIDKAPKACALAADLYMAYILTESHLVGSSDPYYVLTAEFISHGHPHVGCGRKKIAAALGLHIRAKLKPLEKGLCSPGVGLKIGNIHIGAATVAITRDLVSQLVYLPLCRLDILLNNAIDIRSSDTGLILKCRQNLIPGR